MLKILIRNTEERVASYKKLLELVSRDREFFPPNDDFVIDFKAFLRDQKNIEEKLLKILVEEKRYENERLNPPYLYKKY